MQLLLGMPSPSLLPRLRALKSTSDLVALLREHPELAGLVREWAVKQGPPREPDALSLEEVVTELERPPAGLEDLPRRTALAQRALALVTPAHNPALWAQMKAELAGNL